MSALAKIVVAFALVALAACSSPPPRHTSACPYGVPIDSLGYANWSIRHHDGRIERHRDGPCKSGTDSLEP